MIRNNSHYISFITSFIVTSNDENIDNHGYISTSILRIYRRIFWYKISMRLKLIKIHENIKKNSKNDIINNNKHFKVVL